MNISRSARALFTSIGSSVSSARAAAFPGPAVAACAVLVLFAAAPAIGIGDEGADGRFERRDSFHFTLYQDVDLDEASGLRGSRQFEQDVLRELEAAYTRLDRLLALRPDRKLPVTIWDPALFDARFAGLFRFPAAGFYGGTIQIRGAPGVTDALVRVLHHELVHAALDAESSLVLPAWLNEGLAEWFEARAFGKRGLGSGEQAVLVSIARSGGLPYLAELSRPGFGGLGPEAAAVAYLESYAFIEHLAATQGERSLVELWSAVFRSGSLERGVRRAYRRDLEALERAFRASLGAA
ncbi:MAG: hypothetical protein IPK00_15380 [Deltaproteobacteria bacterium]|nr:hypothetical protein [Deltaproteobacteria bacterium]